MSSPLTTEHESMTEPLPRPAFKKFGIVCLFNEFCCVSDNRMKKLRTNYARLDGRSSRKAPSFFLLLTVVLIIASLYWAQAVLIPVTVSILLTFLLTPVADSVERLGLGRVFSVILIVILRQLHFLAAVGWIVTLELTSVANELPTYRQNMKLKIADIRGAGKGGALEKVQKTAEEMKKELEKKDEPAKVQPKTREVVVQGEQSSTFWPLPLDITPLFSDWLAARSQSYS